MFLQTVQTEGTIIKREVLVPSVYDGTDLENQQHRGGASDDLNLPVYPVPMAEPNRSHRTEDAPAGRITEIKEPRSWRELFDENIATIRK